MKKPVLALALAVGMALPVAACGGDDKDDEEQVRDVIQLVNERKNEACDKLTDRYLKDVIGGDKADCNRQVKETPKNAVKIEKVSIDGDKATVSGDIQGSPGELFLVKDDGDWKLNDVKRGE